ncbi:DUF1870 family protein [Rhodococcus sp. ARC_M6]|uniref:Aca2/YdiL-like domain-containing protein n=1 Tax=Rhodococcus sp. ARC_M6 TaxID=2928852 RepID=UPI001FB51E56|nr:DUF1870 family protein [Rhodococcus sp. ARC_M6]MCJ0906102.1 DUF1870 family protein [Rhodococcus sp. ARC_M6]
MSNSQELREKLNLTQPEAAALAGVSLATWRRWEDDSASVSDSTRTKCEKVLNREHAAIVRAEENAQHFEQTWTESTVVTPRQAYALTVVLHGWADTELDPWIDGDMDQPLHEMGPFARIDRRVMFHVGENKAWAAKASERCRAVAEEIEQGVLPFNRAGCYFDELLMAAALHEVAELMADIPELFEEIPSRVRREPEPDDEDEDDDHDYGLSDNNWSSVSDYFDDMCRWDEWEVPFYPNHPLLATVLALHHPFAWFNPEEGTGAGYLQRLSGQVVDGASMTE